MSELTLLALRLGFLLLLWLFIFGIVYALRSDLFGQRVRKLPTDAASPAPAAAFPAAAPVPVATPVASPAALTEPVAAAPFTGGPGFGDSGKATAQNASRLVITSGPKAGTEFPLTAESVTIGRSSDSSLVIRDDYTSTHHARLMLWNDEWMIQDLDSTNGTFLDGIRVAVPTPVPLDVTVKIGATSFELRR
ncbi:FHA domain-containing protein FhaB/FipA [Glaciibacter sp. 2TAF33]|uniref:FHA domain-containing protein FhaB/FipA n=1 Tax=Glaciibacter sp. 2TAF33 TaxID=3233015 RepID=UPI003F90AF05